MAHLESPLRPETPGPFGGGGQNRFGIPFWLVGEFTTHFRTFFGGDGEVHWGYELHFDPWPSQGLTHREN